MLASRSRRSTAKISTGVARALSAEARLAANVIRQHGHKLAQLDPLDLMKPSEEDVPELGAAFARQIQGLNAEERAAVEALKRTYTGSIGAEIMHLETEEEREWFISEFERHGGVPALTKAETANAHMLMTMADEYEAFMERKFPSYKRYSGQGAEAVLPGVHAMLQAVARDGSTDAVVGMAHRGRMAVLLALLEMPARRVFTKVLGKTEFPEEWGLNDDVSSHLFHTTTASFAGSPPLTVSFLPNPSHLEAVNPVVVGKARARTTGGRPTAPILLHGDAAFSGQGVVYETAQMAQLPGYSAGGTLHVVTNNQVGFTAARGDGRSTRYATDVARAAGCPVLHVNGDDVPAVVHACRLAAAYRARFGRDAYVDVLCFRRHGHNEVDEPAFTQPAMYAAIRARENPTAVFRRAAVASGAITQGKADQLRARLTAHLEAELAAAQAAAPGADPVSAFAGRWEGLGLATPEAMLAPVETGAPREALADALEASVAVPDGFAVHRRLLSSHVAPRRAAAEAARAGEDPLVNWATAEAAAFGTLLADGVSVRMSGQDVARGTFSHRHSTLVDQESGAKHVPLAEYATRARAEGSSLPSFEAVSSHLSEFAVVGFEYGQSLERAQQLTLWEAQFGDFVNGAQIMYDNFVTGSESKWLRQTGLVTLLPHGQDGAGPEHSSGRVERFLQLADQHPAEGSALFPLTSTNLVVANLTTPAQYFHFLRRQVAWPFRKPAVVLAPKQGLRMKEAQSRLSELEPATRFQPVLDDPRDADPAGVRRVVLCSGRIYFDLAALAADAPVPTAVVRVEQLAPLDAGALRDVLARYPADADLAWVQEEPRNAGAYAHLAPLIAAAVDRTPAYVGPAALPTAAWGVPSLHKRQVAAVHDAAKTFMGY